jgi:predicted O-methyltransferase YrrM
MKPPRFYRRFDYDRGLLPNAHLRTLDAGVADTDAAELKTGWTIGYPGWGLIYQMLLNVLDWERPNAIIETGTNWGCSTIILAQAIKDSVGGGAVHSVEIEQAFLDKADANLRAAGVRDLVTLHHGDSLRVLPGLLAQIGEVRAAFLDGAHQHDHAVAEFELILPNLAPGGIIIFDNTFGICEGKADERVFGALKTIKARHGGNLVNFEFTSWYTPGLAVWQR